MKVHWQYPSYFLDGGGVLVQHGTSPSYQNKTSISLLKREVH